MQTPVDEIKSRLDIVDVIKEYTNLKQVGVNWKALCPFHNEKTPSFMVSQDKQVWHCFGCGEGGDIFTFIEKIENVDFMEALRILARKANVELKEFNKKELSQRARLLDMHKEAAKFWQKDLFSEKGEQARNYLKSRGFAKETVLKWQLGYADESWDSLFNFLRGRGYAENEIVISGLALPSTKNKRPYDRFRGRLVFPLFDHNGQIVGFTGRVLEKDAATAKYVNSPQTPIYDKSSVIYGLHQAKAQIKERQQAVLVEGNTDVISSHAAGVENVVAVSGTALTKQQLELLKRYTDTLVVAFDQDSAGVKARERSIFLALNEGFVVKVALLPEGHDPDSLVRKNPDEWRRVIAQAVNYIDYYFKKMEEEYDLHDAQGKKKAAKVMLSILSQIPDQVELEVYLQKLAGLLGVSPAVLKEAMPKRQQKVNKPPAVAEPVKKTALNQKNQLSRRQELLLACLLAKPEAISETNDNFPAEFWSDDLVKNLYNELSLFYNQIINKSSGDLPVSWLEEFEDHLKTKDDSQLFDFFRAVKILSDDLISNDVDIGREFNLQVKFLKKKYLREKISSLQRQLVVQGDDNEVLKQLNSLISQLSAIDK